MAGRVRPRSSLPPPGPPEVSQATALPIGFTTSPAAIRRCATPESAHRTPSTTSSGSQPARARTAGGDGAQHRPVPAADLRRFFPDIESPDPGADPRAVRRYPLSRWFIGDRAGIHSADHAVERTNPAPPRSAGTTGHYRRRCAAPDGPHRRWDGADGDLAGGRPGGMAGRREHSHRTRGCTTRGRAVLRAGRAGGTAGPAPVAVSGRRRPGRRRARRDAAELRRALGDAAEQVAFPDPAVVHRVPPFTVAARWARLSRHVTSPMGRATVIGQHVEGLPGCGDNHWARLDIALNVAVVSLRLPRSARTETTMRTSRGWRRPIPGS